MDSMGKDNDHSRLDQARQRMLRHDLRGRDITEPDVLDVMAKVPREEFVPKHYRSQAYADGPLPIGSGQTISQPYIVALMTQLLHLGPACEVLEIGTGSGYQTAVLAHLAEKVYTIEKYPELSASAREVLARLGIANVEFRVGDGSCGWPEARTFDRIMLTAAPAVFPEPLVGQLAESGVIVGPLGHGSTQQLIVGEKCRGKLVTKYVCGCRFVRLVGEYGFEQ